MSSTPVISVSALGFFTFMMFWTLDGDTGRDMNDVLVEYWAGPWVTEEVQKDED
jgi:hypothetical protein